MLPPRLPAASPGERHDGERIARTAQYSVIAARSPQQARRPSPCLPILRVRGWQWRDVRYEPSYLYCLRTNYPGSLNFTHPRQKTRVVALARPPCRDITPRTRNSDLVRCPRSVRALWLPSQALPGQCARRRVIERHKGGKKAEVGAGVLGGDANHREPRLAPDSLSDVSERHALLASPA